MRRPASDRKKIQIGKYKSLYGDNWEQVLDKKLGDDWQVLLDELRDLREQAYENQIKKKAGYLDRVTFFSMLVEKMKDPATDIDIFTRLAALYAEVRGWTGSNINPIYENKVVRNLPTGAAAHKKKDPVDVEVLKLERERNNNAA